MKKTQQILATIISLIIITCFIGTAQAQVCNGDYVIDGTDASEDIAALSSCTEVTGNLVIFDNSLSNLSGLENLTIVGGDLEISYNWNLTTISALSNITSVGGYLDISWNKALTSLSGLENITSVGGAVSILANSVLTNLCGLYDLINLEILYIYNNAMLSMDTANALDTQIRNNGFTGTAEIYENNGSGIVTCGDPVDDDDIDLKDYNLSIWDFSNTYTYSLYNMTLTYTLIQDAKGKVTGSGRLSTDYFTDEYDISIPVEIKGKVKGKDNIVTLKYKVKGKDAAGNKLKVDVSLELDESIPSLVGTKKMKLCLKGVGCGTDEVNVSFDVPDGMTGEAVVSIDATLDEKGKKLEGTAELTLSNGDEYPLSAKGKYNSSKMETQYQLKGSDEASKGIKLKLKIDEESGAATDIKAKALGQTFKYKLETVVRF